MFGKLLNKMNPKVLAKIGEDLRKGSYLIGAVFAGMIISDDHITVSEGLVLFVLGLYIWIMAHTALYWSEKLSLTKQGD